jgi:hypothetical protein
MFGFWRKRRDLFGVEMRVIGEEINRSERFGYGFVLLVVELSHSAPRGLSRLFPGRTLSFHILEKNLRSYDRVGVTALRRYHVILPQTTKEEGGAIQARIKEVLRKADLGAVTIGSASYPEDGKTARSLIEYAVSQIPHF